MWCEFFAAFPDLLQSWVIRVQETVLASKAECTIRTYLPDFKRWKLWALSNAFCHVPANTFHVVAYLKCLILKQILLLLYLILFTLSTRLNALPVCQKLIILSFLPWLVRPNESWENRSAYLKRNVESPCNFQDLRSVFFFVGFDDCGLVSFRLLRALFFSVSFGPCKLVTLKFFLLTHLLESSKTDQFRDGACVAIAWSNQVGVLVIHCCRKHWSWWGSAVV